MPKSSPYGVRGLYRDGDDRYRIDLRHRDPRSGKTSRHKEALPPGTTLGAAKTRALDILNAALTGTLAKRGESAAPETFGVAFDRYLEICAANGGARSDPNYKKRHRAHWVKTLGEGFRLDTFSELVIERHKRRRLGEGKAPGTVNRELVTVKHFLNRCVDWGWLPRRPKIKLLQEPAARVRWLTDEERAALSAQLADEGRAAFRRVCAAALLSGQRLGKLVGLQRSDVDLRAREMTIRNTAKGGVVRTHHVPISDALAVVLEEAIAAGPADGPHVFTTGRRKARPYSRSGASSFFAKIVDDAKIVDFHFHDLRHDFATRLRRGGSGLDVVQALLGHATPATTQRYAHIGRSELAAAVGSAVGIAPALPPATDAEAPIAKKKAVHGRRKRAS